MNIEIYSFVFDLKKKKKRITVTTVICLAHLPYIEITLLSFLLYSHTNTKRHIFLLHFPTVAYLTQLFLLYDDDTQLSLLTVVWEMKTHSLQKIN